MSLTESICVTAIIGILACTSASTVAKAANLKWRVVYIGTFHNSRLNRAVNEDFETIDAQLEDGQFQKILKW